MQSEIDCQVVCARWCLSLCDLELEPVRLLRPWDSPGKNTGVSWHFLLQGGLPNSEIKPVSLVSSAVAGRFFTTVPPRKHKNDYESFFKSLDGWQKIPKGDQSGWLGGEYSGESMWGRYTKINPWVQCCLHLYTLQFNLAKHLDFALLFCHCYCLFYSIFISERHTHTHTHTLSRMFTQHKGFHGDSGGKESAWKAGDPGSVRGLGRSPGEGNGLPTPVFLSREFYGQRSLVGYSSWGCKESNTTEGLTLSLYFH